MTTVDNSKEFDKRYLPNFTEELKKIKEVKMV